MIKFSLYDSVYALKSIHNKKILKTIAETMLPFVLRFNPKHLLGYFLELFINIIEDIYVSIIVLLHRVLSKSHLPSLRNIYVNP